MLTTNFRVWLQDPGITPEWTGVKILGQWRSNANEGSRLTKCIALNWQRVPGWRRERRAWFAMGEPLLRPFSPSLPTGLLTAIRVLD
jgi:hypothetical protein